MIKRKFKSYLFHRDINPDEKDFIAIVKAELLYRIFDLDEKNCSCMGCIQNRERYYNYLQNILEAEEKALEEKVKKKYNR
jgi:hypothetical protein